MSGYAIERNGLISQEMLFSSLIYDLVREGMFRPVFTESSGGNIGTVVDGNTVRATLEFPGDEMGEGVQPWRIQLDGKSEDTPGGQIIVGTKLQLPDDGAFFRFSDPERQTESAIYPDIVGRIGVTEAIIAGMKPIASMTSLNMRITGGLVNLNGQILYIPDSEPSLQINDLSPNSVILVGVGEDGTIVTDDDSAPLILFSVYTNTQGVYDIMYSDGGYIASSFVTPGSINSATPYSYRLTVAPRGISCEIWQNANMEERHFSWFCIQRMVDSVTGLTSLYGHSPVICLYSVGNSNLPFNYDIISKSIYKLIVRENDQSCPSKPTSISCNSDYVGGVINPMKQITTAESNQYYVIFPSGINTHRHLYNDEMDMIAYTSAGVLSQWNDASINVYGESVIEFTNGTSDLKVGIKLTCPGVDALGDPLTICAYVKKFEVTAGSLELGTAEGKAYLYQMDGGKFPATTELQCTSTVGELVVACKTVGESVDIMRKYRGGNANYNTAEGMRVLFLIENGGIEKNLGIVQGQHNIPDQPSIDTVVFDEDTTSISVSFTMPEADESNPISLIAPESFNVYLSTTEDFVLRFTEGNSLLRVGSKIETNGTLDGTATIKAITIESGSLGGGDAVGYLSLITSEMSGGFSLGDNILVGTSTAAKCASYILVENTLSQYYIYTGEATVPGTEVNFMVSALANDAGTITQGAMSEPSSVYISDANTPKNVTIVPDEFGFTVQWDALT